MEGGKVGTEGEKVGMEEGRERRQGVKAGREWRQREPH